MKNEHHLLILRDLLPLLTEAREKARLMQLSYCGIAVVAAVSAAHAVVVQELKELDDHTENAPDR